MGHWADGLEAEALARLPEPVARYVRQGARDGVSTAEAVTSWDSVRLLPRVLTDVSVVETDTTMLGQPVRAPIAIAPTSMQRAVHPRGEVAMADGAAQAGSLLCVSSNAGTRFAEISATGVAWWMQMYLTQEREHSRPVLDAAVQAGARAVVLTLDTPVVGSKYDDGPTIWDSSSPDLLRVNFPPGHDDLPGAAKARDLGPGDLSWLGQVTGLPVVVKGVLRPADAVRCLDAGAAAVWVSNHGGRQLDHVVATADVVAGVAAAVAGRGEVYVDGGVRRAAHVVTALARGADAVFLGRLPLYALATAGGDGVRQLLEELRSDLVEAMALLGCPSLTALRDGTIVVDADRPPGTWH